MSYHFGRFLDLWFPPFCIVCGRPLLAGEQHLCTACCYHLPWLSQDDFRHNEASLRLAGRLPFDKAVAVFRYLKESSVQALFEAFKYQGNKHLAYYLAALAAHRLKSTACFDGVEVLVPVPLHPKKQKLRGYNQAACIARALADVLSVPLVEDALVRVRSNATQTRKTRWQRQENVENLFDLLLPERVRGKNVMLVDDVLTTGATLDACGKRIWQATPSALNFFALGLA